MARPISPWYWVGGAAALGAAALLVRSASAGAASAAPGDGTIPGTIFTIVFENKSRATVAAHAPYFMELARTYSEATNYSYTQHPSLPAYIIMTSGANQGITDDTGFVTDAANLGAQMTDTGIPWRAYGEGMPEPCSRRYVGRYMPRHMPFVYYRSVLNGDCASHVVPMEGNFDADLASGAYKYMWITPDACNDMHDCSVETGDAWLRATMAKIFASPGYQRGGVVFVLFDEGDARGGQLGALVISPLLRTPGVPFEDPVSHASYLATVEDLLGLPRLTDAPSMAGVLNV